MKQALCVAGLVGLGLVLTGCDYNRPQSLSQQPTDQSFYSNGQAVEATGTYPLQPFDQVVTSGSVNATVNSNQAENVAHVSGNPSSLSRLSLVQRGRIVYISSRDWHPVDVQLDSQASSSSPSQTPMRLVLSGNTHTEMKGNFLIQSIDASGNSHLKLYWVNTTHLSIHARDNAKLFLAGVVTHLDITASDRAEVNGKYLRAQDSYVLATGDSSVGVNVKSALGTQSMDDASVYYYRYPEYKGVYLKDFGSALPLKGISGPSNGLLD